MVKKKTKTVMVAPEEHKFWSCDGKALKDVNDLEDALSSMNDECFMHHVNSEKNDFSNWVEDILGDKTLASSLRKVKTRKGALKKVRERLKK